METQTISKENLKKIHDVACTTWKTKIEEYASRNLFGITIELTQDEIDEMFSASDEAQTKVLDKLFVKPKNIMDIVIDFKSACKVLNLNPDEIYSESDTLMDKAFKRLRTIIKALNSGWYPDWDNTNQYKYWNYFINKKGVFSFYGCHCNADYQNVPSALYLKNRELAEYCAKIALNDYKEFYV